MMEQVTTTLGGIAPMTSKLIFISVLRCSFAGGAYAKCELGYSIQTKRDGGTPLTLNDGSTWKVLNGGSADASAWTVGNEVLMCADSAIINTDDDDKQVDVGVLSR